MKTIVSLIVIAALGSFASSEAWARGFGGGGARMGGGGSFHGGGGGGGGRPSFGGGGSHSSSGGGGGMVHNPSLSRPAGGAANPALGGGNRPGISSRPGADGSGERGFAGNRPGAGNRPEIGSGNRGNIGSGNRDNIGSGNRANIGSGNINSGNRVNNIGSGNIGNRTNVNINHIGNNNFNNNHFAANHSYNNNWNHGNWSGNWNHGSVGGGYWHAGGGYWHAGAWGVYWGHAGGYWGGAWYSRPWAWGLGAWAIGSAFYNSGYGSYSNPYYASNAANAGTYYDYSQPIEVVNQNPDGTNLSAANDQNTAVPPEVQEGTSHGDLARAAFKQQDYATALRENDLALRSLPKDAALHEFRALVLFAQGDYQQAAATLYAVLSAGPGWDWTTLSGMYGSMSTYTDQLRQLEVFVTDHPDSAEGHFVLAYHYLTCNHSDSAAKQLREVIRLKPQDQLAPQLLKIVTGNETNAGDGPVPQPPDADVGSAAGAEPAAPAAIDAAKLIGKSIARREDGSTFTLTLTADSKFTWSFAKPGQKAQEFGGKYSVDGAVLLLERTDGAQMPGLITMSHGGFNFKLYGAFPEDKGLDFKR